jgi:aryl-alcohol dehydrogenase-like predicted oxidoreductase
VEQRRVGKSGLLVSRLGLGTMTWGRDTDEHESADQLRAFLDSGGNFIDTAATYGDGDSERVIGGLLDTLVKRSEIVLATKAGISFRNGQRIADNSRRTLLGELDGSLRRLGTDHVDIWQLQAWDDATPLDETLSALDYAVSSGRARYIGISNLSGWQSARAATLQEVESTKPRITSSQNEYSLLQRKCEDEVLQCAHDLGLGFFAWSPLGRGVLTGKYRSGTPVDSRGASPHFAGFVAPYLDARSRRIVDAVVVAADGLGLAPLEVALTWVRDAPDVTSSIIGARTAAQLRGVLMSESVVLPAVVRQALNEVSLSDVS